MNPRPDQHPVTIRRFGFTIIELLIVMAMIVLLLSILIVAISAATRTSQSANSRALMNSMKQALVRFKEDVGYYPPVLGIDSTPVERLREFFPTPDPTTGAYRERIQEWWSSAAMAEYLIGYDEGRYDGYGYVGLGETPTLGIRDPGADGVWGATFGGGAGTVEERDPPLDGRVYGPYLELKDERLLGSTDGSIDQASDNPRVFFPGDSGYDDTDPKIIVDYWGNPIRYYRRIYPAGALQSSYRSLDPSVPTPTLSDVFALRPFDIKPGEAIDGIADDNRDPSTVLMLRTAEFALLSAGPDRSLDQRVRHDKNEFNRDNIVELGP